MYEYDEECLKTFLKKQIAVIEYSEKAGTAI